MKPTRINFKESSRLLGVAPLALLRALRDQNKGESIAFFQTAEVTVIGLGASEVVQVKNENPFPIIQQKIKERAVSVQEGLPFFQGGALGYFSYDSVRFLEETLLSGSHAPLFDAEVVFYEHYILFDHLNKKVFVTEQGSSKIEACASFAKEVRLQIKTQDLNLNVEKMKSSLGKSAFLSGIAKLKEHILDGDIFQAVLSDRFSTPYSKDPLELFDILAEISPAPYQFYFSIEDRVYLGASPEMLIKSKSGKIETHPIAGTRPRGANASEDERLEADLLADTKEKAEHLMLVDLSRNDIGRVATPGSVVVDSFMKVRKFGGVMHLVSVVSGKLKPELHSIEALASCFPAGTLSGAPKIRAMQLISEIEKAPRNFYGGAFICASATGDLDSCITIRSISVENGIATVQAGAGIVADSVPEKEYDEILAKSNLPRKALAIALSNEGVSK